jgi:hypothetical protein
MDIGVEIVTPSPSEVVAANGVYAEMRARHSLTGRTLLVLTLGSAALAL